MVLPSYFCEQPFLVDDGGVVVLFDHVDGALAGGIAQDDGVGLEPAGDFGGGDFVEAGVQIEIDRGAGDGEVLVVDGEGDGGGLLGRGERGGKRATTEKGAMRTRVLLANKEREGPGTCGLDGKKPASVNRKSRAECTVLRRVCAVRGQEAERN